MRHLITGLTLAIAVASLAGAEKPTPAAAVGKTALRQAEMKRAFETLRQKLAILAGRMEAGDEKDKERARQIRAALKEASERGTEGKFDVLIRGLAEKGADKNLDLLASVIRETAGLREDLKRLIAILAADGRDDVLKKRADGLKAILAALKDARDKQARLQARTERGKEDAKDLAKLQEKLKEQTEGAIKGGEAPPKAKAAVGKAVGKQGKAAGKLGKGKPGEAAEDQAGAVDDLDDAIREIEDDLRDTEREREERKIRDLLARARKMLQMQIEIRDRIDGLYVEIRKTEGEEMTPAHAAKANRIADAQSEALKEAEGTLALLRGDDKAPAFAEVMEQVEKDMLAIRTRMDVTDAGKVTQRIADDVVDTLKEMVKALEKAKDDVSKPPMPPTPPGPKPPPGPPKPLVDFLQQLKMIQAMQKRVNGRTELYAKRYSGEQAPMPELARDAKERRRFGQIRKELGELATRQASIKKVTKGLLDLSRE